MIPPFIINMIVTKVMHIFVDKIKITEISDYVFKENNLDEQVKVLRDELDQVKVKLIKIKEELK
tara:strand:- start:9814 stop:10005 length:192 start_codon:yes stop_codon:yes gene_type:complete